MCIRDRPERIDDGLLATLARTRLRLVVVSHANHPHEIDETVVTALARLAGIGATLLNQTVLLRGVNDTPETLAALSERLFTARVLPYYLHLLDPELAKVLDLEMAPLPVVVARPHKPRLQTHIVRKRIKAARNLRLCDLCIPEQHARTGPHAFVGRYVHLRLGKRRQPRLKRRAFRHPRDRHPLLLQASS